MKPWEEYQQSAPTQEMKPWEEYAPAQSPDFMQRMATDFEKRKAQVKQAEQNEPTNELAISKPLQVVGANLGLIGDTLGNVLGSGARYIGDAGQAIFGDVQAPNLPEDSLLTNNMVVRGAKNIISSDIDMYKKWAQNNPEAAANLGAVGNIAVNAPLIKPLAAGASMVGKAAGKVAIAPVKATAKNISTGIQGAVARDIPELEAASQAIRETSKQAYTKMRDIGAVINRNRGVSIANNIEASISKTPLNRRLHGDTLSVLKDFKGRAAKGNMGLEELDQYRQLFSDVVRKNTDVAGAVNADGMLASKAIRGIDDSVEKLGRIDIKGGSTEAIDALNAGRKAYAKARKFEQVSDILRKADGDPNKIKAGLARLANNPKKLRGFSPVEINAIKEASRQTATEGLLKSLGKFGFDLGTATTFGNTALPVLGGVLGTPALTAAGTAARVGQKYLARGKAEQLLKTISGEIPK